MRKEKISLKKKIENGNNLRGRVEDVIYIGKDKNYGVRFDGGKKVRVREQNILQGNHEIVQIGDEASVSFTRVSPRILTE